MLGQKAQRTGVEHQQLEVKPVDQCDEKPARDGPQGQRRQVTVLFADVADFTPLAERLGEEDAFRLMRRVSAEMMAAVHGHGGTVQDFTGDGIMEPFGAPAPMPFAVSPPL